MTVKIKSGTSTEWTTTNPVLARGEIGFDHTTNITKVGNGTSSWTELSTSSLQGPGGNSGSQAVPAGTVIWSLFDQLPGWLRCDGAAHDRKQYSTLSFLPAQQSITGAGAEYNNAGVTLSTSRDGFSDASAIIDGLFHSGGWMPRQYAQSAGSAVDINFTLSMPAVLTSYSVGGHSALISPYGSSNLGVTVYGTNDPALTSWTQLDTTTTMRKRDNMSLEVYLSSKSFNMRDIVSESPTAYKYYKFAVYDAENMYNIAINQMVLKFTPTAEDTTVIIMPIIDNKVSSNVQTLYAHMKY